MARICASMNEMALDILILPTSFAPSLNLIYVGERQRQVFLKDEFI